MTRGRAATPDPFDLGAVAGSDELAEALSTRRFADLDTASADDPAAALLAALVADVDAGAPPLPPRTRVTCGVQSTRRRGVRAFVAFGVAALVLTSAASAAAGGGGGDTDALRPPHGTARHGATERSNENTQRQAPTEDGPLTDRQPAERQPEHLRHIVPEKNAPKRRPDDQREHHPARWGTHPPTGLQPTPHRVTPTQNPSGSQTTTPAPEDEESAR